MRGEKTTILDLRVNKFIQQDCIESAFSWLRQYSLRQAGPLMARKWCKRSAFFTNNFEKENNFWQTYVLTLHQRSSYLAHGKDDVVEVSNFWSYGAPKPPFPPHLPVLSRQSQFSITHPTITRFHKLFQSGSSFLRVVSSNCASSVCHRLLLKYWWGDQLHNTLSQ